MKRAIALCGGGTKGIYEIGVWKALRELNIDYQIVTGTSIGAVNGAVMAMNDYELADELWNNIRMEDIMLEGVNLTTTIEGMYNQKDSIKPFLKKYIKNKGADVSPFLEFIDRQIDEERLRESDIDYGLVTVRVSPLKAHELRKSDIPAGRMKDYIMASSSIFPIFPMHKIDDELYLDGCYYDNLPIELALKMGADEIIAVDLHTNPIHSSYTNKPYVHYILPSKSLGTILNFDKDVLKANRRLGYYDTLKYFDKIVGFSYMFDKNSLKEYEKHIFHFVTMLARTEAIVMEKVSNVLTKTGDNARLCQVIEEGLGLKKEKYTREDYFIGAAEICGKFFKIQKKETWSMKEFLKEIMDNILPVDAYPDIKLFQEKGGIEVAKRVTELKLRRESSYIIGCIYYALKQDMLDLAEQSTPITFLLSELTAALFLLTVS